MEIAVIGTGARGTTLASILSRRSETCLWAREDEVVETIRRRRENDLFLNGFGLPSDLRATGSVEVVLDGVDVAPHAALTNSKLDRLVDDETRREWTDERKSECTR